MKTLYIDNAYCEIEGAIHIDRPILSLDDIDYQIILLFNIMAEDGEFSFRLNALEMVRNIVAALSRSDGIIEWQKISLMVSGLSFEMAIDREGFAKIRNIMPDKTEIRAQTTSMISCFDKIISYSKSNIVYYSDDAKKSVVNLLDDLAKGVSDLNQTFGLD